ncbi:Adhesion G-protein coupled receptor D1 [Dissostichus eleginoides]|uniref:Adhesion G-protein coupled receptor D1 n=1 Tax=Dissostichus eleginoides TaxID=100907 RepID=A0AAD9FIK5_DISEL|nr:Adhesion G-protein coupled receptor D1 [Dissostichus eleginoides]
MRRDPAEVLLPHGHPSLETSGRITFIVLVDAELSRQQSYHSHVDLSSAPLTSEVTPQQEEVNINMMSENDVKQIHLVCTVHTVL